MAELRSSGWVFEAPAAGVPFYNFYSYYKFDRVDWQAIWITIPSQLALTFFGILHVPINVPNLVSLFLNIGERQMRLSLEHYWSSRKSYSVLGSR